MKYVSKAPLRIGLAGGGTDVSPYCDQYGGEVLNATIDLYATVVIEPRHDNKIVVNAINAGINVEFDAEYEIAGHSEVALQIGVYNRIVRDFAKKPLSFTMITTMDAPTGSGLGTSSTMMVAIIGAFVEWLKLPLGEYDIARLAVDIERGDLNMIGGKQDQFATTFGGMNYMEFYDQNRVIVNPLRIKSSILKELEFHLMLFYTQTKRESSKIIEIQKSNFETANYDVINATHKLKEQAAKMKQAILMDDIAKIGELLKWGWDNKKLLASGISNPLIDQIHEVATNAGATGGKISGAGGGGFMIFYCPGITKYRVIEELEKIGVKNQRYSFQNIGLETWTSKQ